MKIYNLKNFAHGLFMLALGLLNLLFNLQTGLNWQDYILIGALLFMGGRLLLHRRCTSISEISSPPSKRRSASIVPFSAMSWWAPNTKSAVDSPAPALE